MGKYTIDEWCMGLAYAIPFIRTSISFTQLQPNNLPKVAPCTLAPHPGTSHPQLTHSFVWESKASDPQVFFSKLDTKFTKAYPWGNFPAEESAIFRVFLLGGVIFHPRMILGT